VRTLVAAGLLLALIGCRDSLGRPCDTDEDCGPGFDCFPDVCVRVCTKDDECGQGETCYRYHCVTPGQEHPRSRRTARPTPATPPTSPTARPTPPLPDVTAAELRAIRRELELLRREQSRLAEAVEKLQGGETKKPAKAGPVKLRKQ
jgi:hypothetical protein